MKIIYIILFGCFASSTWGQSTIKETDIAIRSQLTLLKVVEDVELFESSLATISRLAKKNGLEETYDWLTYKSATGEYLFVMFSTGLHDILTLESYKSKFSLTPDSLEFKKAIENLGKCSIQLEDNHIIEMVLPWSTVEEIFVSVHPHSTMSVYKVRPNEFTQIDRTMRNMVALLKEVDYPFPLESNRGALGAYGNIVLVWFYDETMTQDIYEHINTWMTKRGKSIAWNKYMKALDDVTFSQKDWTLKFQKHLSY